jgi:ATP-dependent Clp endopeptidase proteolytic subunit ClpP
MSKHGIVIDADLSGHSRACNLKMNDRLFAVNVKENDGKRVAEMLLYDVIGQDWLGDGLTAKRVEDALKEMGAVDEINVLINSPGGIIYEALGIYNALVRHPAKVITQNVGAAWSCAGWIMQAGDERVAFENASLMIHNAQGGLMGDRRDFLKEAEVLNRMDDTIANTFAKRTGRKAETFRRLMDEESWFNANEALANKLIDVVIPAKAGAKNSLDPAAYGFVQKTNAEPEEEEADEAATEIEDRSREVATRLRLLELEAG